MAGLPHGPKGGPDFLVVANPRHSIGSNMSALARAVELAPEYRVVVQALRGFGGNLGLQAHADESADSVDWWGIAEESFAELQAAESVMDHLGPEGKAGAATNASLVGIAFGQLGKKKKAKLYTRRSIELFQQALDDRGLDDSDRADALCGMADALDKLHRSDEAMSRRRAAATIYERLIESARDPSTVFGHVQNLSDLLKKLGDKRSAKKLLATHYEKYAALGQGEVRDIGRLPTGWKLMRLAELQVSLVKIDDAIASLGRAAAIRRSLGAGELFARKADLRAVDLHIGRGEWHEAEALVANLVQIEGREGDTALADDLVLLASIRAHTVHPDEPQPGLERAVAIYAAAKPAPGRGAQTDDDTNAKERIADHLRALGRDQFLADRFGPAQHIFEQLLTVLEERSEGSPGEHESDLADALQFLGATCWVQKIPHEARAYWEKEVRIRQVIADLRPKDEQAQRELADVLGRLAQANREVEHNEESIELRHREIAIRHALVEAEANNREGHAKLAAALELLGAVLGAEHRDDEAIDAYANALAIRRAISDLDREDPKLQLGVAKTLSGIARFHSLRGRLDEAERGWNEGVAILTRMIDDDPEARDPRRELADTLLMQGWANLNANRPGDAKAPLDRALQGFQDLAKDDPDDEDVRRNLAGTHLLLAQASDSLGDPREQCSHLSSMVEIQGEVAARNPGDLAAQAFAAGARAMLGQALGAVGDDQEAVEQLSAAADVFQFLLEMEYESDLWGFADVLRELWTELVERLQSAGRSEEADAVASRLEELGRTYPEQPEGEGE